MRGLTVVQPWTWSIMHGKPIENRTWKTTFRGTFALHAGKGWDWDGADSPLVQEAWRNAGHDVYWLDPDHDQIALGAVLAVADLVDICDLFFGCDCGPWATTRNQYHWRIANVRPLAEPVPCKGALGLWTLPDDVEAAVAAQLREPADA